MNTGDNGTMKEETICPAEQTKRATEQPQSSTNDSNTTARATEALPPLPKMDHTSLTI